MFLTGRARLRPYYPDVYTCVPRCILGAGPHLPFLVMIISVPTALNCFHSDAFSSSIFTCSLPAVSVGTGGGARALGGGALAAMLQEVGNRPCGGGASPSVGEGQQGSAPARSIRLTCSLTPCSLHRFLFPPNTSVM